MFQSQRSWVVVSALVFILTRTLLLLIGLVIAPGSSDDDIRLYARWGQEWHRALADGVNFYDRTGMEYPPPAMLVMLPPASVAAAAGEPSSLPIYRAVFRILMFALDVTAFLVLLRLLPRLFPVEECRARVLAFLVAAVLAVTTYLHRLDLVLGVLTLVAVGFMLRGRWVWGMAALAAGVGFKIAPACLIPLFVLGSLPSLPPFAGWGRTASRILLRGLLAIALVGLTIAPFVLAYGPRALDFIGYHKDRGLEVGSTYASLLWVRHLSGGEANAYRPGYGSLEVTGPGASEMRAASPVVTVGFVLGATALLAVRWRRIGQMPGAALATRDPGGFAAAVLLALLGFMLGNKVFSPQYMLWFIPLLPLIGMDSRRRLIITIGLLGVCALTTFTYTRGTETLWQPGFDSVGTRVYLGPDAVAGSLLAARNGILFVLAGLLGWWLAVPSPGRGTTES